jgi:hypothetical protein
MKKVVLKRPASDKEIWMKLFKKAKLIILLAGVFGMSAANALLYVEPYIGYRMMATEVNTSAGTAAYSWDGVGMGARLGASFLMFAGGVQYEMGSRSSSLDDALGGVAAGDTGTEYDDTNLGAFVAFTGLPLINVWGTYFFNSTLETTASNDASDVGAELSGGGYGVGAGFTGLPFLSINLDYRMYTYDESTNAAGNTLKLTNEYEATEIMLSVSSPWDF